MRVIICIAIFFFALSGKVYSQLNYRIKGSVADTALHIKLQNTAVSVLNEIDSTLVKFGWADAAGNFGIDKLQKGKYILLLSYPEYADYVYFFELDSVQPELAFRTISMSPKARLLEEVIIRGKVNAIKIKGDTTEYNARAFVIQPNAKVEDLLRQLPGIQVDNNGKITAQGEKIRKVLLDGEEFFGDDPTLVTRNLRADMIDKVQLYDKKSDQAVFTGIDDGIKEKTINLVLKEDKKKGYFGRLEAGAGTDDFYQLQGMANLFRQQYKIAAYGNMGNTGVTGLSSSESNKYGTGGGTIEFISGGVTLSGTNADEIESGSGRFNGQGLPLSHTSGAHLDAKWNQNKESINTNVKIGDLGVEGQRNTFTQNDLPGGLILNRQQQHFSNYNSRQRFDANYLVNFNPATSLRLKIDGINKQSESTNDYNGNSTDQYANLLNSSIRRISNNGKQQALNIQALYNKKLKKQGRTLSWNLIQNFMRENTEGYLKAVSDLYSAGNLSGTEVTDQFKQSDKALNAFNSNLTYTEPLSKSLSLGLNYSLGLIHDQTERKSYNAGNNGGYTDMDTDYSNNIALSQFSNQTGTTLTYQKGKQWLRAGAKLTAVDLKQTDRYTTQQYNRHFVNVNPQLDFRYSFSQQQTLMIAYGGATVQPKIDQIQPVKVNTDPLNIIIGNEALHPAFRQSLLASYNIYKPVTGLILGFISSYELSANPIVSSVNTDAFGGTVYQSVNAGHHTGSFVLRGDAGKQLKTISGYIGLNFFFNAVQDAGISNGQFNRRTNNTLTTTVNFSKNKAKKYDLMTGFGPRFFSGGSSLQNQLTNNGHGYDGYLILNIYLPYKFEIQSSSNFNYQSATETFREPYKAFIIDGTVARKFLKDESLKFSVSVKDLLNQNTGFNRSAFGTMVTQTDYTTISRYLMCTLSWDFSRFGKSLIPQN